MILGTRAWMRMVERVAAIGADRTATLDEHAAQARAIVTGPAPMSDDDAHQALVDAITAATYGGAALFSADDPLREQIGREARAQLVRLDELGLQLTRKAAAR